MVFFPLTPSGNMVIFPTILGKGTGKKGYFYVHKEQNMTNAISSHFTLCCEYFHTVPLGTPDPDGVCILLLGLLILGNTIIHG